MYDAGEEVSWASEEIKFIEGERCFEFSLDDSMPGEAVFKKIVVDGKSEQVRIDAIVGSGAFTLPKGDSLLSRAITYLNEAKSVERIAVYDAQCGFYMRLSIHEII
jgi:hypothetical protein